MNKDSRLMLNLYSFTLGGILLFIFFLDNKKYPSIMTIYNPVFGFLMAVLGIYTFNSLQKVYGKSFWSLKGREQKFTAISLLITSLGIFMFISGLLKWIN